VLVCHKGREKKRRFGLKKKEKGEKTEGTAILRAEKRKNRGSGGTVKPRGGLETGKKKKGGPGGKERKTTSLG